MAHSAQINVNGVLTNVTEFDNPAQAIDDAVTVLGAPTTPQAALSNLGAGVRPRLGINMDFRFNQRNQDLYTASGKTYTVDGWYLSNTGMTCAVGDGQVTITPASYKYSALVQTLEQNYAGGAFTFSALVSGASGQTAGIAVFDNSVSTRYAREGFVLQDGLNLLTVTAQIPESSPGQSVILYPDMANGTAPATFYSAKPEEGEGQTLAYQDSIGAWHRLPQPEDGDYAGQLAKCKLYLNRLAAGGGAGLAILQSYLSGSTGTVYFPVPLDCPMRPGNPTIVSYKRMDIYSPSTGVVSDAVITAVNQGNCLVFQAVKSGLSSSGFILTLNNVLVSNEL